MTRIELITLKDPYRFCDWMTAYPERIPFLMDTMFTMRQQYPDTELIFSLDPSDDDAIVVEPYGSEPYRFRVSEYRAIEETLRPHSSSASYHDFIRRYSDWRNQFQAWIHSYRDYMTNMAFYQERKTQ